MAEAVGLEAISAYPHWRSAVMIKSDEHKYVMRWRWTLITEVGGFGPLYEVCTGRENPHPNGHELWEKHKPNFMSTNFNRQNIPRQKCQQFAWCHSSSLYSEDPSQWNTLVMKHSPSKVYPFLNDPLWRKSCADNSNKVRLQKKKTSLQESIWRKGFLLSFRPNSLCQHQTGATPPNFISIQQQVVSNLQ